MLAPIRIAASALIAIATCLPATAQQTEATAQYAFLTKQEAVAKAAPVDITPDGSLKIGNITALLELRTEGRNTTQDSAGAVTALEGYPRAPSHNTVELVATFQPRTAASPFELREHVEILSPELVRVSYQLQPQPVPAKSLRWVLRLPADSFAGRTLHLDGRAIELPRKADGFAVASGRFGTLQIPADTATITISPLQEAPQMNVLIGDGRHYGLTYFSIIVEASSNSPQTESPLRHGYEIRQQPYRYSAVEIGTASNMGFTDEVSGDRKGGWTDEGKDHDLSALPTGLQTMGGIPFWITPAQAGEHKGALVFAGAYRDYFIKEAQVPVTDAEWRTLYLLHAFAWDHDPGALLGTLVVHHTDGDITEIPVRAHIDATNWTAPYDAPNGILAWRGASQRYNPVGLNLSHFSLPGKPVRNLEIRGSGNAVWMIAGITSSPDAIAAPDNSAAQAITLRPDTRWQTLEFNQDVTAGSILDFSHMLDAPAGKHGPLIVNADGHFAFEQHPQQRVRLWGTNLNFGTNFVEKTMAERLSRRLAALGYNTARIHHFDQLLLHRTPANSHDIDPQMQDRLDYLIHSLKEAGLYIVLDLYSLRQFPAGELDAIPTGLANPQSVKAAIMIDPQAQAAWEQFALKVLRHRNPYTGLTYAEDPAIVGICPVNENALQVVWPADAGVARLYQQAFSAWLDKQNIDTNALPERERSLAFARFLEERQKQFRNETFTFLRETAGTAALLTDVNHRDYRTLNLTRDTLDYVDVHRYWDHPRFAGGQWGLPYMHSNTSAIGEMAEVPRTLFPTRIIGKPYAVTEINYVFPNAYRAEAGPLFGAYAAFQDWDMAVRFAYNGGLVKHLSEPSPIIGFNNSNDPIALLTDRLITLLFVRQDVSASANMIGYEVSRQSILSSPENLGPYESSFSTIGLLTGVGTFIEGNLRQSDQKLIAVVRSPDMQHGATDSAPAVPAFDVNNQLLQQLIDQNVLPDTLANLQQQTYRSDTGELELDAKRQRFTVITPRTEAFMMAKAGEAQGNVMSIRTSGPAMLSVSAMDGQSLSDSQRLLLLHLTDVQNTGSRFRSADRTIIEDWGKAPLLVERGTAEIELTLQVLADATATLYALSPSGERLREIPLQRTATGLRFTAQTVDENGNGILAYELLFTPA